MKKLTVLIIIVVTFFGFIIFGFKLFVTSIRNERDCKFANIDNIELNVGVNIPKIDSSLCNYDKVKKLKSVYFKFKDQNSKEYISTFKFEKIKNSDDLEKDVIENFLGDYSNLYQNLNSIYIKKGNKKNNSHFAIYNADTNEFWAVVYFKD